MDNWISNDDESVDMKAKNSLLSSLIVKTGGVTFLAYLIIGVPIGAGVVLCCHAQEAGLFVH